MDMELHSSIFKALTKAEIMTKHFPMLLRGGIPDVSLTIHSHFLTLLTTTGQTLGFAAVTECPITWAADYAKLGDIRADSMWFDPVSLTPRVAIEFERFEKGDEAKLRQKVENLAIISLSPPGLDICLLVYWVRSGAMPRTMESVVNMYHSGFRRKGHPVPGAKAPLMIVKCVLRPNRDGDCLLFGEFLRDERNESLATGRI